MESPIENKKPNSKKEVELEWKWIHFLVILLPVIFIIFLYFYKLFFRLDPFVLVALGTMLNIWGAVLTTIKAKYYGLYYDGGEIERWRQEKAEKPFLIGLILMAIGSLMQVLSAFLSISNS